MPSVSTILTTLPFEIRMQLEKRLIDEVFSNYEGHSRWLAGLGYKISRMTIGRYARRLRPRIEAVASARWQLRAAGKAAPGEEGLMAEALSRLLQQKLFMTLFENGDELDRVHLLRFAKVIGELSHRTLTRERWHAEVQERLEKQHRAAQQKLSKLEGKGGLSKGAARQIRDLILGINPLAGAAGAATDPAVKERSPTGICAPRQAS